MPRIEFSALQEEVLKKARDTYGSCNQILVSAEECCELAKELLKYPRYHDHETAVSKTFEQVLDERADLEIVLNHVDAVYGFTENQLRQAIQRKLNRLKAWLDEREDMEYTTELRELPSKRCEDCFYNSHWEEAIDNNVCKSCTDGSNFR